MTRVTRYKLGYLGAIAVLGSAVAIFVISTGQQTSIMLALIAMLLIPGRIQRVLFKDFYHGRRLLGAGRYAEAIESCERFLRSLHAQPWRKQLVWLSYPVYTSSIEAMALNNLAAAQLWLGRLPEASATLRKAIALDPLYAHPYFNMAVLHAMQGERAEAELSSMQALKLGYAGGTFEAVIQAAASLESRSSAA